MVQPIHILIFVQIRTPSSSALLRLFVTFLIILVEPIVARNSFVHIWMKKILHKVGGHLRTVEIFNIAAGVSKCCFSIGKGRPSLIFSRVVVRALQVQARQSHLMRFVTFFSLEGLEVDQFH